MKHLPMANARGGSKRSPLPPCLAALTLLHFLFSLRAAHAQDLDYPTAGLSTTWTSTPTMKHVVSFSDGSQVRSLLLRRNRAGFGNTYAFGFYCRSTCNSSLLAIFIIYANSGGLITLPTSGFPQVVWTANRARPVGENATLQLSSGGDLVLEDADGTKVWSTNTSGKSVSGISITEFGNLVLFGGAKNQTIWDSSAYPTDSLVPGQRLLVGQSLAANDSSTNSTQGLYYLYANSSGLIPFIKANPPTKYSSVLAQSTDKETEFFEFMNGSISTNSSGQYMAPTQFLRLESDGHLRVYGWSSTNEGWKVTGDLLTPSPYWATCFYPTVCGRYGICSANEQCGCPQWSGDSNYFVQVNSRSPSLGCKEVTPLSCQAPYNHSLLRLNSTAYFTYDQSAASISSVDEDGCRSACAKNCSCKAAFFRYFTNTSEGSCYLTSEVFSLKDNQDEVTHYNSTTFLKVQIPTDNATRSTSSAGSGSGTPNGVIIGSALGASAFLLLVIGSCVLIVRKKIRDKRDMADEDEEDDLDQVSGTPRRFSLEELRAATNDFSKKLGQGGFGSVYEGRIDDKMVAVKRLDGVGRQGRKEFLAEVQTIGKIHHVNLVKLIGYCVKKSCRLLVYEFMINGSLDRWIFSKDGEVSLDWQTRCKIILGVAKGLSYLHEECSQRIAHLDIKPQNILLDDRFEAKVSDFGLAKLIDRDQTHVETRMRGTPGYLAPEWLSSMITEKVDVYSFGVVILEVICGRRNLDRSQPEEDTLLVALLKRKAENGEPLDFIDERIKKSDCQIGEAMKMIQLARWCLQEQNRRPSMSTVVKALEGTVDVEPNLEEMAPTACEVDFKGGDANGSTPLLPSVLSGPR